MNFLNILIVFLNAKYIRASVDLNDVTNYYRMPDVYNFDDYDKCLGVFGASAVYCVANSFIKPDPHSELYEAIKSFSSNTKQHLRHDKLQRGICLNICQELMRKLGNESQKYFVEEFPMDSKLIFDFIKYPNAEYDRLAYNEIINKCVNVELMDTFNLSAFSAVEYCNQNEVKPLDTLELLTSAVVISIVSLAVLSTFYDRHLKNLDKKKADHYKAHLGSKWQRVLTIFSIKRNWHILSAPVKENVRHFRFLDAFRTINLLGVIHSHCIMYSLMLPSSNPEFFENAFGFNTNSVYICGNPIIQTFLVIGGFLTAYLFMTRMDKEKTSNMALFFRGIVSRYIRLAPLLAITILLHSTWLYRLGGGPFWDRVNFTEKQFCRDNWWTNLLFLDNYINVEHKCLIQSWYLAVDFWCRILATLCLIQIYRKPTWKTIILTTVICFSAVAIGITVYVNKFEAIPLFVPENIRNQFLEASEKEPNYYKTLYVPTHLNVGSYFIGVMTGLFSHRGHRELERPFVVKIWHRVVGYSCLVIFLISFLSKIIFHAYDFEKPSILNSFVSIELNLVWSVVVAVLILALSHKMGWFIRIIMSHGFFRITGRISYATFIIHMFVVKLIMPSVHQPLYLSNLNIVVTAIAVYVISSLLGLIMTLCIELPVATICGMLNLKKGL